jgi:cyclopropane-fatty-acyl-phospholipid synthase
MFFLLQWYLRGRVNHGDLRVIGANGVSHAFGDQTGKKVCVRLNEVSLYWKLALHPDRFTGEAYMDGALVMESGSIYDLLTLIASQNNFGVKNGWTLVDRMRTLFRWIARLNPVGRAQKNVAHHYDLSGEIYDLFLDRDRQYSCAYYEYPDQSLEDTQLAKKRHLAAKLDLCPGMKVLDIG